MEISILDKNSSEQFKIVKKFEKENELDSHLMPYKVIKNTQLQSSEARKLSFTLPDSIRGKLYKLNIVLKFYEVPDEFLGDLKKATWISSPFLTQEIELN